MLELDARGGKNWVLGVTALASFTMAQDGQVITTAFATTRGEFGASVETLQWTVNGYNLTFAVLLLTGAALGDRFGRRAVFAAGILAMGYPVGAGPNRIRSRRYPQPLRPPSFATRATRAGSRRGTTPTRASTDFDPPRGRP